MNSYFYVIKYVEGDIFAPLLADKQPGTIILPHVCNDKGGWGSGFVIPLGKTFPKAKEKYLQWHKNTVWENVSFELGKTQLVEVTAGDTSPKIVVCNMVAQTLGGVRPLFYNHLVRCMEDVASFALNEIKYGNDVRICAPMFGASLAGGDWNFIEQLIVDCWIKKNLKVTIHYLANMLPSNWTLPVSETQSNGSVLSQDFVKKEMAKFEQNFKPLKKNKK